MNNKKGQPQKRGIRYEKEKVKDHKRKHIGGPGNPDAPGMEVKCWISPASRPDLIKAKRKGVTKFINKGGFTKQAVEYGKEKNMKLYEGKKRIT